MEKSWPGNGSRTGQRSGNKASNLDGMMVPGRGGIVEIRINNLYRICQGWQVMDHATLLNYV